MSALEPKGCVVSAGCKWPSKLTAARQNWPPAHDRNLGRDREGTGQRVLSGHPRAACWPPMPLQSRWKAHQVPDQIACW